jgi:hypothetical protein
LENARRLGLSVYDNVVGREDDYETAGERFGRGINETIAAFREDPRAMLGLLSEGIGDSYRRAATLPSLDQIRAGEAPGAVDALGFAAIPAAPALGAARAANVLSANPVGRDVAGALDDLRRSREAMLSASNETPFDELVRMSAEAAEARKRAVEALSTSEGGVRLINPSNDRGVAVTPGLSGEEVGKFRLTFIDESRTPTNHVVYNTREEALEAALGAGFTQTLGPRPAASALQDFGYYQDNPALTLSGGEEWLAYKQKVADDTYARRSGITGSTTATLGQRAEMFLPTDFLRRIPGLLNERRVSGEAQYDALLRNVQEKGFLPDQGGNKVLLGVNHRGEPFLIEGNTRVAVASDVGVPSVRAEVHYFNGGEMVEGQFAPENVAGIAASKPVSNYRDGGQVMMRSDMSSQMEGGIGGLSDRARDMFSRPRGVGTFAQYMNEGGSVGVSSDVIDRLRSKIIEETGVDPFDIAREEGIDPDLMLRVIQQESSGNPNAQSEKGAFGYMQLMPGTAKELGVDRMDPVQNMRGGARYLRRQLDEFHTVPLALAAYNAGPGNVSKYGAIPPFKETIKYVSRITGIPFTDPSLGQTRSQAAAALGVVRPMARPADLRDPRAAQENQILQLLQQSMQGAQMQPQMQAAPQQQPNPNPVQSSLRPIARPAQFGMPQGAAPFAVPGQAVLPGAASVLPSPFGQ